MLRCNLDYVRLHLWCDVPRGQTAFFEVNAAYHNTEFVECCDRVSSWVHVRDGYELRYLGMSCLGIVIFEYELPGFDSGLSLGYVLLWVCVAMGMCGNPNEIP